MPSRSAYCKCIFKNIYIYFIKCALANRSGIYLFWGFFCIDLSIHWWLYYIFVISNLFEIQVKNFSKSNTYYFYYWKVPIRYLYDSCQKMLHTDALLEDDILQCSGCTTIRHKTRILQHTLFYYHIVLFRCSLHCIAVVGSKSLKTTSLFKMTSVVSVKVSDTRYKPTSAIQDTNIILLPFGLKKKKIVFITIYFFT